jgi:hypothetical protein
MSETEEIVRVGDPMPRLGSVSYHNAYEIVASWLSGPREGKADIVDLAPVILAYKVYRPLRDNIQLLKSVHLSNDGAAIAWGDDDATDMAATTVERLAEETMSPSDFRAWLERQQLTQEQAAAQLGISRRLVAYYAGKRHVPRYIALACRYLDSQLSLKRVPSSLPRADTVPTDLVLSPEERMVLLQQLLGSPGSVDKTGKETSEFTRERPAGTRGVLSLLERLRGGTP